MLEVSDGAASSAAGPAHKESPMILCTACRVRVYGSANIRAHYKSELHRVNLKRKVLELEPLSQAEFQVLAAEKKAQDDAKNAEADKRRGFYCAPCVKRFSSQKALQNHVRSKRCKANTAGFAPSDVSYTDDDGEVEICPEVPIDALETIVEEGEEEVEEEDDEEQPLPPNVCVFDKHVSASAEENAKYMAETYGFFIPYVEYLVDLEGLLTYLSEKVNVGHVCINCDKQFESLAAVQQHMRDSQHRQMTQIDEIWVMEYARFYYFDQSDEEDDDDAGEEGWEEVEDGIAVAVDEENGNGQETKDVVLFSDSNSQEALSRMQPMVANTEGEALNIISVNGRVLGHRALLRYYRQKYAPGKHNALVVRGYQQMGTPGQLQLAKRPPKAVQRAVRAAHAQKRYYELKVGAKNYYTRKSKLKPSMAVFNSGYRP